MSIETCSYHTEPGSKRWVQKWDQTVNPKQDIGSEVGPNCKPYDFPDLSARLHLLKVPTSPQTVPIAGVKVFKHMTFWTHFTCQLK